MKSQGIKDFESFRDHGKDVSGNRSSIIQGQESAPDFSLQHDAPENDAKISSVNLHDEPEKFIVELALDRDSTIQNMAKTENLDRESSRDESGHSDYEGECNTEGGAPVLQISRTKGSDSSLIEIDGRKSCVLNEQTSNTNICGTMSPQSIATDNNQKGNSDSMIREEGKYFYYETPLYEETGIWIPVSVPPMTARGKVTALASGDIAQVSWISTHLIEQAWKEMAQSLTEANFSNTQEILESEPPKWLPDSAASSCMLCSVRFHPIMCTRHHCRFCGGIFCSDCTKGRSLLPKNFRTGDPQRVCDVCCVRLESVQPYLMDQVSRAAQLPTHDLTDLSTLRSWLNFPWGQSMEYEIYKATNTIRGYATVGSLRPERRIPEAILHDAKGLAILTVAKVGMMVTYNIGTGLVVALREDGSWSPPSAITTFGVGWGVQAGGELTDFIIVLRTNEAVKNFCSDAHFSIGAGLSAAVGIIGRTAEADMRAGPSGFAACYTYSCSKGAFVGCSLEGSVVATRVRENSRFYGSQSINASQILLGSLPRPPAAATLYRALGDLYMQLGSPVWKANSLPHRKSKIEQESTMREKNKKEPEPAPAV
ncbi:UNVERIFIED_CONTAM: SH3 domain-containing protein [Sesamum calycinum]|uniref:SH3 domain-containing protein n=1 Tax=Sesamum calycinum TaxID=2727403 RepID=A0AAW2Q7C8_9LAMI